MPASRVLRECGYVIHTGRGQRRSRPGAFVRAVVKARGIGAFRGSISVPNVVRWAFESEPHKVATSVACVQDVPRAEVMALAREGIAQYREALLDLAR